MAGSIPEQSFFFLLKATGHVCLKSVAQAISRNVILVDFFEVFFLFSDPTKCVGRS